MSKMDSGSSSSKQSFSLRYQHAITAAIDLAAGSAGGIACVLIGQPLDTMKVKMQTFPELYKNSLLCFKKTFMSDGIRGFYAGTVPALMANVAENSVLFCAYGVCQNAVQSVVKKQRTLDLNPLENASAGFLAAFFSSISLCPTELVKCRLQAMRESQLAKTTTMSNSLYIGPWGLTKQILKTDGIAGLFRGFTPTVAREMPGYFFFFGGYELFRNLLTPHGKTKDEIGLLRTTLAGGIGGMLFWVAIFPADVVKSRIQIAGSRESMLSVVKRIIKKDGFRALYKGLGPTVLRTFPASGVLFVAYEYTKKFLHYVTGCPISTPVS